MDLALYQLRRECPARFSQPSQRSGRAHQDRIIVASEGASEIASKSSGFLGGVYPIKVDQTVEREETTDSFIGVAASHHQLRDPLTDGVVKLVEFLGGPIYKRREAKRSVRGHGLRESM